jgi:hypothetical protein
MSPSGHTFDVATPEMKTAQQNENSMPAEGKGLGWLLNDTSLSISPASGILGSFS